MEGTVLEFKDKHWHIETEQGVLKLMDWQCEIHMEPGKQVVLRSRKSKTEGRRWFAYATDDDCPPPWAGEGSLP